MHLLLELNYNIECHNKQNIKQQQCQKTNVVGLVLFLLMVESTNKLSSLKKSKSWSYLCSTTMNLDNFSYEPCYLEFNFANHSLAESHLICTERGSMWPKSLTLKQKIHLGNQIKKTMIKKKVPWQFLNKD